MDYYQTLAAIVAVVASFILVSAVSGFLGGRLRYRKLAADFTADNTEDTITFISDGTDLYELARSGNGA